MNVGKIAGPLLTTAGGCFRLSQVIPGAAIKFLYPGPPYIKTCSRRFYSSLLHEAIDATNTTGQQLFTQYMVHARRAIGTAKAVVKFPYSLNKPKVMLPVLADGALAPGVEAACRNAVEFAELAHVAT
jgi:hypothetical protein